MSAAVTIGFPPVDRDAIVALLLAYEQSLGLSLCFQDFECEIASLPGAYAPPHGAFAIGRTDGRIIGVAALRGLDIAAGIAEMKRLFVTPEARGSGLGRALACAIIAEARRLGYRHLRLDTLPSMTGAQALYEHLGFRDISNYNGNPIAGSRFLELALMERGDVDRSAPGASL